MNNAQRDQLMDRMLSVLALLQRMPCLGVWQQLRPYYARLATLLCLCCDSQEHTSELSDTLLRYQRSLDLFGLQSSLQLSEQLYGFLYHSWNADWVGGFGSQHNPVCVLLHMVLCQLSAIHRICDELLHRWLRDMQDAAVCDDGLLLRLWGCAASILQVNAQHTCTDHEGQVLTCGQVAVCAPYSFIGMELHRLRAALTMGHIVQEDLFVSWICNVASHPSQTVPLDKGPAKLASCLRTALFSIGEYLPDLGTAVANSGLHTVIQFQATTPCSTYHAVASLFLTQESLPGALRFLCLMAGTTYKGAVLGLCISVGLLCDSFASLCHIQGGLGY